MRLFTLGARLETAASFIPPDAVVADVGTDHARLPIWLVKTGRCRRIIASDIADTPVRRARENVERWGVSGEVQVLQCAGLDGADPQLVTHIVICGMGGETIAAILRDAPWTKDPRYTLILQAETAARQLREFLYENGYTILREPAVIDGGRVYSVLLVRGGEDPHRGDPLYARLSAPLLTQHDRAAALCVARARRALEGEMRGMAPDSAAYRAAEEIHSRILDWEANYAQGIRHP